MNDGHGPDHDQDLPVIGDKNTIPMIKIGTSLVDRQNKEDLKVRFYLRTKFFFANFLGMYQGSCDNTFATISDFWRRLFLNMENEHINVHYCALHVNRIYLMKTTP